MFVALASSGLTLLTKNESLVNMTNSVYALLRPNNMYRLLTSSLTFGSTPQWFVGTIVLYQMRVFERMLSSKKFASFLCVTYLVNLLCQMTLIAVLPKISGYIYQPISGPYFILFGCLPFYYSMIPRINSFPNKMSTSLLVISEKSMVYFLLLQLILSYDSSVSVAHTTTRANGAESIISLIMDTALHMMLNSLPSIVFGALYMKSPFIQRVARFPAIVERIGTRLFKWLDQFLPLSDSDSRPPTLHAPGNRPRSGARRDGGGGSGSQPQTLSQTQDEDEILRAVLNASMQDYNSSHGGDNSDTNEVHAVNHGDSSSMHNGYSNAPVSEEHVEMLLVREKYLYTGA